MTQTIPVVELASQLGVREKTIRRWIRGNELSVTPGDEVVIEEVLPYLRKKHPGVFHACLCDSRHGLVKR